MARHGRKHGVDIRFSDQVQPRELSLEGVQERDLLDERHGMMEELSQWALIEHARYM